MSLDLITVMICLVLAFISWRHKDWHPIAVATVLSGVLSLVGIENVQKGVLRLSESLTSCDELILFVLFILAFAVSAAMWMNSRIDNKTQQTAVEERNNKIAEIEIAGYQEESGSPKVTEWDEYIENLAQRLSKTKLDGESFALGIAGDWGSGKTTFLRQLKTELEKTFVVLDFNPWICTNAKIVVADFFNTLNRAFPGEKDLINDIKKYVVILTDLGAVPDAFSKISDFVLQEDNESITSLKDEIEKKLNNTQSRYLVLIDDLDRLEHQELFEVLRLIRITASFSNLLFVVTYDKHHIEEMLNANHISNGELFVKKIFNTEIVLPELEPYKLPQMLIDEITRLLGKDSRIPVAISNAVFSKDNLNVYRIVSYLQNYRDIKRFAMAFSTEAFNIEQKNPLEFSFEEFFWLNLLRYADYDTFNMLRTYPTAFLEEKNAVLTLKENIKELDQCPKSNDILKRLFSGSMDTRNSNSIRYKNNFHNYFSFRIQKDKVSIAEFNQLIKGDGTNIKQAIDDFWAQNRIASLLDVLKQTLPNHFASLEERKNYLSVVIGMTVCTNKHYIPTIREKLNKDLYQVASEKEELSAHTGALLSQLVESDRVKANYKNELLSHLHSVSHFAQGDEEVNYTYRSIVADEFLVEQSKRLLKNTLDALSNPLPICSITANGKFRTFLESATVNYTTDITYDPVDDYYKCLPFDELLEYFCNHQSDQLDQFMKPIEFDEDELQYAEEEAYFSGRIATIEKIVGSRNNFRELITKCFTNSDEDKERWLKYWKLSK